MQGRYTISSRGPSTRKTKVLNCCYQLWTEATSNAFSKLNSCFTTSIVENVFGMKLSSPFMASSGLRYPGPHPEQLAENTQHREGHETRPAVLGEPETSQIVTHPEVFWVGTEKNPQTCRWLETECPPGSWMITFFQH